MKIPNQILPYKKAVSKIMENSSYERLSQKIFATILSSNKLVSVSVKLLPHQRTAS